MDPHFQAIGTCAMRLCAPRWHPAAIVHQHKHSHECFSYFCMVHWSYHVIAPTSLVDGSDNAAQAIDASYSSPM